MYFEVKKIYMKLLGVDWLSPTKEIEFQMWYENYYNEEYGIKMESDVK